MPGRARRSRFALLIAAAVMIAVTAVLSAEASATRRVCWPGFSIPALTIPAVTIPAVTIPAVTIPAVTIPGFWFAGHWYAAQHYAAQHYPAQRYPAQHYRAQHYPAQHYGATCFSSSTALAPSQTTVRVRNYRATDRRFSPHLSSLYWQRAGLTVSYPNVFAPGYGQLNGAGFPKNQYVRSYLRRDGTFVNAYWRNSPTDGLPTCRIIRC
jgi:hypothetical protein